MILFVHNRYRIAGGEERAVADLMALVRERLHEDVTLLERDSALIDPRRAALSLLRGGLNPAEVSRAVRDSGARVMHAHNLLPAFGWRGLAAARGAGAALVMHLHQYRLVCAVGVCFTAGTECTRCHGINTLPGVLHNCRGSRAEAAAYGAAIALWQRRTVAAVDAFIVPSQFAADRLSSLGLNLDNVHVVPHTVRRFATRPAGGASGYAFVASRLSPEKGIKLAIDACRRAGIELVVAGEGPARAELETHATRAGASVRFVGRASAEELAVLRDAAAVAVVPSVFGETFALSAAEAMAAGLPVAASRIGALAEILPDEWLARPGDVDGLADTIVRLRADRDAGAMALQRIRAIAAPEVVAPALAAVYDSVSMPPSG